MVFRASSVIESLPKNKSISQTKHKMTRDEGNEIRNTNTLPAKQQECVPDHVPLPLTLSSSTCLFLVVLLGTSGSVCEAAWVQSFGTSKTTTTRQQGVATTRTTTSRLFSTIDKPGQTNLGDSQRNKKNRDIPNPDMDQARNTLENLVASTHDVHKNRLDDDHQTVPVTLMTSAGRRRRQLEMDLLRQLAVDTVLETDHVDEDEDDLSSYEQDSGSSSMMEPSVVDELMHLWMYEPGPATQMYTRHGRRRTRASGHDGPVLRKNEIGKEMYM